MTQGEGTIINGSGSQVGALSLWGDYTMMAVDPSDDCTFWYTNQYLSSTGEFNWHTRIASFQLPGCSGGHDFSLAANPGSLTLLQGNSGASTISTTVTSGSAGTVALTVSVVPTRATPPFSPPSVTPGAIPI